MSDNTAAWEPQENTYVLTVVLSGVKKVQALEIASVITEFVTEDYPVGDVLVTAAHVKHNLYNPRASR